MKPKIGIVSDHGGFALKEFLRKSLEESFEMVDYGTKSEESVDYPSLVGAACQKVLAGDVPRLIALCGTGIGASIAANRFPNIRAALCHDEFTAEMSRRHNDANVLVLGGRVLGTDLALRIVQKWIQTNFEGGRHERRLQLIEDLKP
ncbi:ribose 5-phosphate isomerase B [Leptospira ryugenii]|nr:ribose 5-phosphate isomerase B [Leptospira ryugenii]